MHEWFSGEMYLQAGRSIREFRPDPPVDESID